MEFNSVLNGVVKFVDREIIVNMNPWQEIVARIAIARVLNNSQTIKESLSKNGFVRAFAIVDDKGNVDVDGLVCDLKKAISEKGCVEVGVPMFGNFKFVEKDVDTLYSYIRGI